MIEQTITNNKKGFTLVEVMVASCLFVIVITIVVGAFLSINRARVIVGAMKETQQRIRIANEMIARFAKEAEYLTVKNGITPVLDGTAGDTVEFFYSTQNSPVGTRNGKKFAIEPNLAPLTGYTLNYYECASDKVRNNITGIPVTCDAWTLVDSLLGGEGVQNVRVDNYSSGFTKKVDAIPPSLDIQLGLQNTVPDNSSFEDTMVVYNTFALGGLR